MNEEDEVLARLTMLEFMLEVAMANQFSEFPEQNSLQVKADLVERMKRPYGALTGDRGEMLRLEEIAARATEMAARFVDKVARREAEIRETKSRGQ